MTDRELMQQALEALGHTIRTTYADARFDAVLVNNAITALRERLAQPEPAPGYCQHCKQYTIEEPLPAQTEQKPVAWANKDDLQNFDMRVRTNCDLMHTMPLYTTPPRREWVGLTEAEKVNVAIACGCADVAWMDFADAIEANLREKNS